MQNFITNAPGKKALKDRLSTIISISEELKFLVGFFYFTGRKELYNSLQSNPNVNLRILVGLQVNKMLDDMLVERERKLNCVRCDFRGDSA